MIPQKKKKKKKQFEMSCILPVVAVAGFFNLISQQNSLLLSKDGSIEWRKETFWGNILRD